MPLGKKILIVDDDSLVLDMLTATLEETGFQVISTSDPKEFKELLLSVHPHLALSDIQIPEINGFELLQWAKKTSPGIPFVMMSSLATTETRKRAQQFGADDFFDKPVDQARLKERLAELIELSERKQKAHYALVADDHAQTREILAGLLTSEGWEVERAVDGEDALRRARTAAKPFDVAFIDIVMPKLGGIAAIRAIRSACPTTVCVAITGEATAEETNEAYKSGATTVIRKPIDQDDFVGQLPKLIQESEQLKKKAPRNTTKRSRRSDV